MTLEELLEIAPYSLNKEDKHRVLDEYLVNLTKYHYKHSEEYRKMLDGTGFDINKVEHYEATNHHYHHRPRGNVCIAGST